MGSGMFISLLDTRAHASEFRASYRDDNDDSGEGNRQAMGLLARLIAFRNPQLHLAIGTETEWESRRTW
jgi:hypothetical protein